MQKWGGSFKSLLLKNHRASRAHIYGKAFWYKVDLNLFQSLSPGFRRGHNRDNNIYMCLYWKKNLVLRNQHANFNQTRYKSSLGIRNSKLIKLRARSSSKGRWLQKCKNWVGSFLSLFKSWSLGVRRCHSTKGKPYIEKIYFSRTSWPISIKLGVYHPWV
jgi:hypothetical protein